MSSTLGTVIKQALSGRFTLTKRAFAFHFHVLRDATSTCHAQPPGRKILPHRTNPHERRFCHSKTSKRPQADLGLDRACERQFDEERTTLPGLTLHAGLAIVGLGNTTDNGEAKTDARGIASTGTCLPDTGEFLE